MKTQMKFDVSRARYSSNFHLRIARYSDTAIEVATALAFQVVPDGSVFEEPLMTITASEAQELANQLYAAGVRPEQAVGSAGQLDAVKHHLDDMRKLVFKAVV